MLAAADLLVKAGELISPPGAWTQEWFAKTCDGTVVSSDDPRAACWCVYGAVERIYLTSGAPDMAFVAAVNALRRYTDEVISYWNDAPGRLQHHAVDALLLAATWVRAA